MTRFVSGCNLMFFLIVSCTGIACLSKQVNAETPSASQPSADAKDTMEKTLARIRFAPLWMHVPKFPREHGYAMPSSAYDMIWEPGWQEELELSVKQKAELDSIYKKAVADDRRPAEAVNILSSAENKKWRRSTQNKPTGLRDNGVGKKIEAVLTSRQLQTLKDFTFARWAVNLLYDADIRRDVGFSKQQENRLRQLAKERIARFQQESLAHGEKVWGLLTKKQKAEIPSVVKRQGPTSAIISLSWELGFSYENFIAYYPMLGESPVRERLQLSKEQDLQLQGVMDAANARMHNLRAGEQPDVEASKDDKIRVEAILTPPQLIMLNEINFRRQVVLALSSPDKRGLLGVTAKQTAALRRFDKELYEKKYRIDRKMLGKAIEIITPSQRAQLNAEIDRRKKS
ncbi:hypothetical protein CA54_09040 [Symmachiella macrocystis]|uniref:LTXXQ motif protein n=1 Tax=Symmachiella macrocystis TaxID=2527985 RepID=A0A5C6BL59_9PLAN|nr:hypothetical protein [Symmachiella macrocystis]TWU12086.1 hypothetical protein CA54_09040 [Symmachiella macrocystis]